jgi:hypothetical protein
LLFSYVTGVNTSVRFLDFTSFVDKQTGLLRNEFGRYFKEQDPIHLGKLGIRTLADTFISAIFRPLADSRLYSSITSPDRAHL